MSKLSEDLQQAVVEAIKLAESVPDNAAKRDQHLAALVEKLQSIGSTARAVDHLHDLEIRTYRSMIQDSDPEGLAAYDAGLAGLCWKCGAPQVEYVCSNPECIESKRGSTGQTSNTP